MAFNRPGGFGWSPTHLDMSAAKNRQRRMDVHRRLPWVCCVVSLCVMTARAGGVWADYEAGLAAFDRKEFATALRELEPIAEMGNPDALFHLGELHKYGLGVPENPFKAFQFWDRAAELDQANAILCFGFAQGRWELLHPPGLMRGIEQLKEEAAKGEAYAMWELAWDYSEGWGVPRDHAKAFTWWKKAAALDDLQSAFALGVLYATERGVEKDDSKARRWYERSARRGHIRAMYELGRLLVEGRGGPKEPTEGMKWWAKAAEEGEAPAMFRMGEAYVNGLVGTRDDHLADQLWQRAATQGYVPAMMALASLRRQRGEQAGSETSLGEAYFWYDRAAWLGDPHATVWRDQVAARLSADQFEKVRQRAHNWQPDLHAGGH